MKDKFAINNPKTEEKVTEPETVEPTVETPVAEEQPKQEKVLGIVINCARLRVREHPNINAKVISEIKKGSEVIIDESRPTTSDFFPVITVDGLEGYCMKDYIQIK